MGAIITGEWTAKFFQDDNGDLKCKCTLRLHDSENGWGSPTSATADVKIYKGASDRLYDLKAEAGFSDTEPHWLVMVDNVSLASGSPVPQIKVFDMDAYEINLKRQ